MTNQYGRGKRIELGAKYHLQDEGYVVTVSAGSKGKLDVIAIKPGQIVFAQCKITGTIGPDEWDRVVELAGWVGAKPLLVEYDLKRGCQEIHRPDRQRPSRCGLVFTELLGPKVRGAVISKQPCRPWVSDEIAAAIA